MQVQTLMEIIIYVQLQAIYVYIWILELVESRPTQRREIVTNFSVA